MIKKSILFLVALCAFSFQVNAQLLWKVSGKGIKSSYIFGTNHVAPASICDSIAGFDKALNSCSEVYGEIVMYDMMQMAKDMLPYMALPADSTLSVIYNAEEYGMLDDALKRNFGLNARQFENVKPVVIESQFATLMYKKVFNNINFDETPDVVIQKRAKEKGISVKGLETLPYQAEAVFGSSISEQAADLMLLIKKFDLFERYCIDLCNIYMKQDINAINEMFKDKEFGATKEQMDRLIYNRNRNWVVQLEDVFPLHPVFVAVGAGHLPGEQGLIELIRKQGYTVTPVD